MPGATHERVEKLRDAATQDYNRLFYADKNGKRQPQYAAAVMAEKEAAIVAKFDAALAALMAEADKLHTEAEAILAQVDNPYSWLTDTEMQRAATLAPFVKEDIATMDAGQLVEAVKTAARDKAMHWLIYRYAEGRYRELDGDVKTALGMGAKVHYEAARNALRDGLMPADKLRERKTAEKQQAEAQSLFDAAEWARPQVRQDFAARAGVKVEYLP